MTTPVNHWNHVDHAPMCVCTYNAPRHASHNAQRLARAFLTVYTVVLVVYKEYKEQHRGLRRGLQNLAVVYRF